MKRVLVVAVLTCCTALVPSCGGMNPMGGGGGGGGTMPAMSPYMWATDFSDYKPGAWCKYKSEAGGYGSETTIKCVGKDGDNLWIEVTAGDNTHLLVVGSDRTVSKAWFSGKDDKEWKKCDITKYDAPKPSKECPACKKEHKAGSMNWSDDKKSAGGKDMSCKKCDATGYDCKGNEAKSTSWYCKDVPQLMAMGGKHEHGGLVGMEAAGSKMTLLGCGNDAKPKHDLPKDK
jgi:hypothetical protein